MAVVDFGGEADTPRLRPLYVAYGIFGGTGMGQGRIEGVLGEDRCDGGEVRATSSVGDP